MRKLLSLTAALTALSFNPDAHAAKDIIVTAPYKETVVYIKYGRGKELDGNVYYRGLPCGNIFTGVDCEDRHKVMDALYNALTGYKKCKNQRDSLEVTCPEEE